MLATATKLNRRSFLRASIAGVGFAGLVRLRPPRVAAAVASSELQVLDADQADLLAAIVERMVFSGDPAMPAVRDTDTIFVIDQAILQAEEDLRDQVGWLLTLFDYGPPLFDFRFARFRDLSADEQDEYIRGWATSRFALRRMGFQALKNLAMLGYYSQDATWSGIGYHGPWAPRPRRQVNANGERVLRGATDA